MNLNPALSGQGLMDASPAHVRTGACVTADTGSDPVSCLCV